MPAVLRLVPVAMGVSISSLRRNVPSPPSCTQHTRFGVQFWTDEKGEKEEVLMVSIDTCIPRPLQIASCGRRAQNGRPEQ